MQYNEIEVGQKYAFRQRLSTAEPLLQVQVIEKTGRRGQVKIRRVTEPYEGLEEWVTSRQLVVPWTARSPKEASLKKILYIDMDGVIVDFESGIKRISAEEEREYKGRLDDVPGIFALMDPMPGALEAYRELSQLFDTYILSTAPWENVSAWSDKLLWVKQHLGGHPGDDAYKRLILTHHKDLNVGDFLIDDREKHGSDRFVGEHILFGSARFPDWPAVVRYLKAAV